jgi:hypothetical protein
MDKCGCFNTGGHRCLVIGSGYVQGLKVSAMNSRKGCMRKVEKAEELNVIINLSHVELPLCSGEPFQKCGKRSLQSAC